MGENSFSALGDRYCAGWVLQRFLHFFAWRETKRSLPVNGKVYQLNVKFYPLLENGSPIESIRYSCAVYSITENDIEVGRGLFEGFEFAGVLFVFALGDGVAAEEIDGAAFGGCGQPCRGIIGDARLRPLFECGDECFLREIFG